MQRPGRRKTVAAVELCQAGADGPVRIISEASLGPLAPRVATTAATLADAFLPEGYPRSVAPGYGAYQL